MSADFRQLMSKPVIRLEDVSTLRAHIEQRHPDSDSHVRAELMAEGINRMLDSAMTGLDGSERDGIKKKLISEQLIGSRQSVLKIDVLNRILALDLKPEQLMAKTWGWYVLNTGHSVTLSDFIEQTSPYIPHSVRETLKANELRNTTYQAATRDTVPESEVPIEEEIPAVENSTDTPNQGDYAGLHSLPMQERLNRIKTYRLTSKGRLALCGVAGALVLFCSFPFLMKGLPNLPEAPGKTSAAFVPPQEYRPAAAKPYTITGSLDKPHYLQYQNVSIEKLKSYLERKNSMLLTSDYLDQLLAYSYEKNLNPLLLIAIIGQEQNYVPSGHRYAPQMIQNPFNIYGSWETHPVGFTASMKEACYTINAALNQRELYTDPFILINARYAQDPNWHVGVKVIFRDLMALAGE